MSDHQFVRIAREGAVGTLTLNRPEVLNACNPATHREIQRAIDELEACDEVRVLVLRGAGRAFCSGSDLREVGVMKGREAQAYIRLDFSTKTRIATCAKPVIASLQGHVAGGGFEMALACDMRLVADDVQFSLPEIRLGTIPGSGGLQRLPQIVGLGIAKEWAMTGRRIGAEEAHLRGLANAVHPPAELQERTMAFAQELAQRSATALALCKVALDPAPPSPDGLVGIYHRLASQACHEDPGYHREAGRFRKGAVP
ncbi:enoyl-CoA hydratase/isomerase family protein [Cereibacter azotoformans]|uniref:Short chain enoyl-CoA hydratase n=1 Tax=Cereibacter sphaeroides (strain ATCC 17025 / ATH 2.4.3) TaxID=349102 RepID=A4WSR8_CERS5|nr:enoyl-CoA hydratase/isomerase family protein [Cereibacter azotoformans]ULB09733.1 enoyl-CoA hydratase/isomerase family protein [Cereibacter azotoformans]